MVRVALVTEAIQIGALIREVGAPNVGATAVFVGTVRRCNKGRDVNGIEYSAYAPMAEREMRGIVAEAVEQFGSPDVVVEHRLGTLAVGDASVAVAVGHERRGPAMAAMQYVIEQLKIRVPIWKLEHYSDGTRDWVAATDGRHL